MTAPSLPHRLESAPAGSRESRWIVRLLYHGWSHQFSDSIAAPSAEAAIKLIMDMIKHPNEVKVIDALSEAEIAALDRQFEDELRARATEGAA